MSMVPYFFRSTLILKDGFFGYILTSVSLLTLFLLLISGQYGTVAETVAYDLALEVAMKVQKFQQRNLLLHDPWKWLLKEFASYYGVSDIYTKLR